MVQHILMEDFVGMGYIGIMWPLRYECVQKGNYCLRDNSNQLFFHCDDYDHTWGSTSSGLRKVNARIIDSRPLPIDLGRGMRVVNVFKF